ncbi:hypothetical protein ACHWQZ_G015192 [Mnemiopsis leidyi]
MTSPGPCDRDKGYCPHAPSHRVTPTRDAASQTSPTSLSLSTVTCAELVPLLTPAQINREMTHLQISQPLPQTNLTARQNVLLYALLKSLVGEGDQEDIIENIDTDRKMDTLVKSLNFNCHSNSPTSSFVNSTLDKNLKNVILSDMKTTQDNSDRKCAEIKKICSMKQTKSRDVTKVPVSSTSESELYPSYSSSNSRKSPSSSDWSDLPASPGSIGHGHEATSPEKENFYRKEHLAKLQTCHPRVTRAAGLNMIKRSVAPKVRVDPVSRHDTSGSDHSASPCKTSPHADKRQISPHASPRHISPRASPRHISPRASPRHISPRASPRHISPRASPHHISPRASPRHISPRHLLSSTLSPLLDRSTGDTTSESEYPSCASSFISEVNTEDLFSSLESEECSPDHFNPERDANHGSFTAQLNSRCNIVAPSRPYAPLPDFRGTSPDENHVTAENCHVTTDHTSSVSSGHSTLVPASLSSRGSRDVSSSVNSLYSVCFNL